MESHAVPVSLRAQLMRGLLEVNVDDAVLPPSALFGFAERRNPKRAFLFVSKVLGRHIPVSPSVMCASFERLAAEIPADLPGPVLVIGMAETAVGLGAGVHRALSATRPDTVYLVSTRHPLGTELFARFDEEHSHASAHLIHMPVEPEVREMMLEARSLVLVDDEASTGKTFVNLHRALVEAGLTKIERVVTCVLTDWSAGAVGKAIGESATSVSLMKGSYRFHEDPSAPLPDMPDVGVVSAGEWRLSPRNDWGRLGVRNVEDTLAPDLQVAPGEKIIVIGTGEFVWRPFLLAERLKRAGADVHFSSTTRSPIALGHAIEHALSFPDNYGLGIPNFLYNVKPGQFDRVLICTETPAQALPAELVDALGAEVIVDEQ
ncbi:phosphoribosyltransferase domain-containing protein [Burkholderia ubonensis]|uniref:phosphoribosyltransferase domain-containing protein n=1 Tax=Burkholderia ubonensis TaxID=101571 RepID=UPI000751C2FC|nr:phosphoribosyltransferase domain-containing protein [Burkholderia ubonensis]KVG70679.1 phosphoribosyltransferase [Burkholderia ubonensis]KVH25508.1 phosphoribosyltransferase [Burkholderia ubonensis]KVH45400.1 phosphoribosyltransferase [Burkholderia ubonensis]KVH80698.1 phosphoribosyltransferase [Burkholderia ubonensis]KVM35232.1 phosphoribosyltransferase [Burkholderia ubonensis]